MKRVAVQHVSCDYCGLPVTTTALSGEPIDAARGASYCCFGCRFAAAIAQEKGEAAQVRWRLTQLGLAIFFTMNVMVFTLVLWTQDIYEPPLEEAAAASLLHELFRYLAMILSLPVLLLLGGPLLDSAIADLRRRVVSTDLLLLLGVAASYGYSLVSVVRGQGHIYFEVGCLVLVAVTLGRWLEATGKLKTTAALRSLERLLPDHIRRVQDGQEQMVLPSSIEVGDVVRVLPGERIPVDGRIIGNMAAVDQQLVTGESQPVVKEPGDLVMSGTLNLDGDVTIGALAPVGQGALQRLIDTVVAAASDKERYGRLADRLAAFFLPAVVAVAIVSLLAHGARGNWTTGLMSGLAVVLIACPCALALATPMAIWAALGRASRAGVLFRHGDVLSQLAAARTICFDKTGTLTTGDAVVETLVTDGETSPDQVRSVARTLAASSNHVLSRAIVSFTETSAGQSELREPRAKPGRGVFARQVSDGNRVYLGSERWMDEVGQHRSPALRAAADEARQHSHAVIYVAWGGHVRGLFTASESLRPEAPAVVARLRHLGFRQVILTGDHEGPAATLAGTLHVEYRANLLPEDKAAYIRRLRSTSHPVIMVGDGLNDAAALAQADAGIAMGCGADVSRETADLCLLGSDLSRIPLALEISQQTIHTIRWNLLWAVMYNCLGIGLAAVGWLNPIFAAIAMVVSSFLVVSNSLRLAYAEESQTDRPPVSSGIHGDREETSDPERPVSDQVASHPETGRERDVATGGVG